MRKFVLSTVALVAMLPLPSSAAATTDLVESIPLNFDVNEPIENGFLWMFGNLSIEVVSRVAPSADPGSLFPIVIDPNDPPTPPAAATDVTRQLRGVIHGCLEIYEPEYSFRCYDVGIDEPLAESELTIGSVPLPGNDIHLATTLEVVDHFGDPHEIDLAATLERPSETSTGLCAHQCANVNPWISGGDAHIGVSHGDVILFRNGYAIEMNLTSPVLIPQPVSVNAWGAYVLQRRTSVGADV